MSDTNYELNLHATVDTSEAESKINKLLENDGKTIKLKALLDTTDATKAIKALEKNTVKLKAVLDTSTAMQQARSIQALTSGTAGATNAITAANTAAIASATSVQSLPSASGKVQSFIPPASPGTDPKLQASKMERSMYSSVYRDLLIEEEKAQKAKAIADKQYVKDYGRLLDERDKEFEKYQKELIHSQDESLKNAAKEQKAAQKNSQRLANEKLKADEKAAREEARYQKQAAKNKQMAPTWTSKDQTKWDKALESDFEKFDDWVRKNGGTPAIAFENQAFDRNTKAYKAAGAAINDVAESAAKFVALPLAATAAASTYAFTQYETAFTGVRKTVDGTDAELQAVSDGLEEMALRVPVSSVELAGLAQVGGQLGIPTENLLNFTEAFAALNTATNLQGEDGAATLARFVNVMGEDYDNIWNIGSAITHLGNTTATTEAEIATMAQRMGSMSKVVGISSADTLGYSAALSSLGIKAEMGGSAMTRIWNDITLAVSKGEKGLELYAKQAGVSSKDFAKAWKEKPTEAFNMILKSLSQSKDMARDLADLGINNVRDIQTLMKLGENYDYVMQCLESANTAYRENTALQEEANRAYSTTGSKLKMAGESIVQAGRNIGEAIAPKVVEVAEGFADVAQGISDMDGGWKEFAVSLGGDTIKGTLGLLATGKALSGIAKTKENLTALSVVLGKLGTPISALMLGKIGIGIAAAGAVAAGATAWYKKHTYEQENWAEGFEESTAKLKKYNDESEKLQNIQKRLSQAQEIIQNPNNHSKEELEGAKQTIHEIADLLNKDYNLNITVNDDDLDGTAEKLGELTGGTQESQIKESRRERYNTETELIEARDDFEKSYGNITEKFGEIADLETAAIRNDKIVTEIDDLLIEYRNGNVKGSAREEYKKILMNNGYSEEEAEIHLKTSPIKHGSLESLEEERKYMKKIGDLSDETLGNKSDGSDSDTAYGNLRKMQEQRQKYIDQRNEVIDGSIDELINPYGNPEDGMTELRRAIQNYGAGETDVSMRATKKMLGLGNFGELAGKDLSEIEGAVSKYQEFADTLGVVGEAEKAVGSAFIKNGVEQYGGEAVEALTKDYEVYADKLGVTGSEFSKGFALIENGFTDFEGVLEKSLSGDDAGQSLDNFVKDYVEKSKELVDQGKLTTEEWLQQAAAFKEGYETINEAKQENAISRDDLFELGKSEGATDKEITNTARKLGLLTEDKQIKSKEGGGFDVVNDMTKHLEKWKTNDTVIDVAFEGDVSAVDDISQELAKLDGKTAKINFEANGEPAFLVIGDVQYALSNYDSQTGTCTLTAEDGTEYTFNTVTGKIEKFDGQTATVTITTTAETDGLQTLHKVGQLIRDLRGDEGVTFNVNAEGNVEVLNEAGKLIAVLKESGDVDLQIDAEGNLEILDKAGEKLAELNKEGEIEFKVTPKTDGTTLVDVIKTALEYFKPTEADAAELEIPINFKVNPNEVDLSATLSGFIDGNYTVEIPCSAQGAEEAIQKLSELGIVAETVQNGDGTVTITFVTEGKEQLEQGLGAVKEGATGDATLNVTVTGEEVEELKSSIEEGAQGEGTLTVNAEGKEEVDAAVEAIKGVESKEVTLTVKDNIASSFAELKKSQPSNITANVTVTPGTIDTNAVTAAINAAIQALTANGTATGNVTITQGVIHLGVVQAAINAAMRFLKANGNISSNITVIPGVINTDAVQAAISTAIQSLSANGTVTANITYTAEASEPEGYQPSDKQANVVFNKDSTAPDNYQPPMDKTAPVVFSVDSTAPDSYQPADKYATVHYTVVTEENARGTQNFKGGLAKVNDQKGVADPRELIVENGRAFIPEGKDVILPLSKGAKIYTAAQTKAIMSRADIPHFEDGLNNFDFAVGLYDKIKEAAGSVNPISVEEHATAEEKSRLYAADLAEMLEAVSEEDKALYAAMSNPQNKYTSNSWQYNDIFGKVSSDYINSLNYQDMDNLFHAMNFNGIDDSQAEADLRAAFDRRISYNKVNEIYNASASGRNSSTAAGEGAFEKKYYDPTEAMIDRINLNANRAEKQEELMTAEMEALQAENEYARALEAGNKALAARKQRIDELTLANSELDKEFKNLSTISGFENMASWYDEFGNATEDYYYFINNLENADLQANAEGYFANGQKYLQARLENEELIRDLMAEQREIQADIISAKYGGETRILEHLASLAGYRKDDFNIGTEGYMQNAYKEIQLYTDIMAKAHAEAEHYRSLGFAETSEEIQAAQETWWSYRNKVIAITEEIRTAQKGYMQEMIDMTISLIKQEKNDEVDKLNERVESYQKIVDSQKEVLSNLREEREYTREIADINKELQRKQEELEALNRDNSNDLEVKQRKKELAEEIADLQSDMEKAQSDRYLDLQEQELDKSVEIFTESQEKKIEEIEDFLNSEGLLYQEAIKRIDSDYDGLYDDLIEWNKVYGTGVDEDVIGKWQMALTVLEDFEKKLGDIGANEIMSKLKEGDDTDYDYNAGQNKVLNESYAKSSSVDAVVEKMKKNSELWHKLPYSIIGAATGDTRTKYDVEKENEELGASIGAYKVDGRWYKDGVALYHDGGVVGGERFTLNTYQEEYAKLLKGEFVATPEQQKRFLSKTMPNMLNNLIAEQNGGVDMRGMTIKGGDLILQGGTITKETIPEIKNALAAVQKDLEGKVINKIADGFSKRGMSSSAASALRKSMSRL